MGGKAIARVYIKKAETFFGKLCKKSFPAQDVVFEHPFVGINKLLSKNKIKFIAFFELIIYVTVTDSQNKIGACNKASAG